ncbi:MAG: hypothetical protein EBR26_05815, partial [Microbacteriaceae bacterium]|nr:hypothetical protein [Microbacteriaceae bacterium]
MASDPITYDRAELRGILKAFKAMDDQAVQEARTESSALATYAANQIKVSALGRTVAAAGVRRVAEGVRISK